MVDGHRAAEDVEGLDNFYDAGCDCANGSSGGRALVDPCMKIAGRLSIVKALHTKRRDDATGNRRGEGIFPIPDVGDRVAKGCECLHFFRRGMQRFDLRREGDILRGENRFANGQANGRDGRSVLGEEFDWIDAWEVGYSYGHQAEPFATFLLVETYSAAV